MMKSSFPKVSLAVLLVVAGFGFAASAQRAERIINVQGGGGVPGNINIQGPGGRPLPVRPPPGAPGVGGGGAGGGVTTTITVPSGRFFDSNVLSLSRGEHAFSSFMTPAGIAVLNDNVGRERLIISGLQTFDTTAMSTGRLYLSCGAVVDINRRVVDTTRVVDGCVGNPNDGIAFWTGARVDAAGSLLSLPSFVTGVRFSFEGAGAGRDTVLVSVSHLQRVINECRANVVGGRNVDLARNLAIASTGLGGAATITGAIQTGVEVGRARGQAGARDAARAQRAATPLDRNSIYGRENTRVTAEFRDQLGALVDRIESGEEGVNFRDEAHRIVTGLINNNRMGSVAQGCVDRGFGEITGDDMALLRIGFVEVFDRCSLDHFTTMANANVGLHHLTMDDRNYAGTAVLSGFTTLLAAGGTVTSAVNIATINRIRGEFEDMQAASAACARAVDDLVADIDFHQGGPTATRR